MDDKKPKFISETPPYNHEEGKFEWDGPWEQHYENGQLMSKGTLNDGKMVGPWIVYYENGNIKREDMLLREDGNGLMVNKNRTIAVRDSFVAKQFNKALGVNNEPEASPEQFGKLAERLERNRQMQGKGTNVRNFKNQFGSSPYVKNLQKKKAAAIPTTPIKLDTTLPPSFFRSPPTDPRTEALGRKVMEDARRDREEKERMANSGLAGLIGGALKNE